jgi:hypothetical protein
VNSIEEQPLLSSLKFKQIKPIPKGFLLVDDDPINNLLKKMMLKKSFENVLIHDFTFTEDGLGYI